MSAFITIEDYDASIHAEILNAVTRNDKDIIAITEDRAMAEMKGYLTGRYDTASIFSKTGNNRHPLILMFAIDIVLYNLHCAHNPKMMPKIREDRYNRAITWLSEVQKGNINPVDLPALEPYETHGKVLSISNTKRSNHY